MPFSPTEPHRGSSAGGTRPAKVATAALMATTVACQVGIDDTPEATTEVWDVSLGRVTVEPAAVPLAAWVDLHPDEPVRVRAEYGIGDAFDLHTPWHDVDGEGRILLLGMRAATEYRIRLVVDLVDEHSATDPLALTTGGLPPSLTSLDLELVDGSSHAPGYVLTQIYSAQDHFVVVLDDEGQVVWYWETTDGAYVPGIGLNPDGTGLMFMKGIGDPDIEGPLVYVSWDGTTYEPGITVPGAQKDFAITKDGTVGALAWVAHEADGQAYITNAIHEVGSPPTEPRLVWDAWEDIGLDPNREYDPPLGFWGDAEDYLEIHHANYLGYDAREDAFFTTMYWTEGVARVDRSTGAMDWMVATDHPDRTHTVDPDVLNLPHSVQWLGGDRILVYDNAWGSLCSRAVVLELDHDAGTAAEVWGYDSDRCLHSSFLGNAERLPGGNTLISYATAGQIDEVDAEANLVWRVKAPLGNGFGYAFHLDSMY